MFSYSMLLHTLVFAGLITLLLALKPAFMMISELPSGTIKTRWKVLLGLIWIFIFGYMIVLVSLSEMPLNIVTYVLAFMLFGGGVFVWILCNLSFNTVGIARRLVELEYENIHDSLMGIYNRRHLDNRLIEEFKRALRYNQPLTYMMLDVDHFKKINDKYGHDIGDQVLIQLAKILKKQARDTDIIARYGGEEIGIICPQTEGKGVMIFAERMLEKVYKELTVFFTELLVEKGLDTEGDIHNITVSIGIACMNDDVRDAFDLIKQADKALYKAKHNGRNCAKLADTCNKKKNQQSLCS